MNFRILGPLEVHGDGGAVEITSPKQRALLVLLLLNVGRAVSVDRLIDALWAGDPPGRALVTLRSYVSNLRRALNAAAGGHEVLVTRGRGYALEVEPEAVDAVRLERLAEAGRTALDRCDAPGAIASFDAALALWRGEPLADVAYADFAQGAVARLEALHLAVQEGRFEALLQAGRQAEVIPALEALVAEHPLRERPRAQLMVALYRTGRASDALAVHREFRERLAEETGLDPSASLAALAERILNQAPELDAPRPARRDPPASDAVPAARQAAPAPRASGAVGLGASIGQRRAGGHPRELIGREGELERLRGVVIGARDGTHSVLVVTGEPGVGKTALLDAGIGMAGSAQVLRARGVPTESMLSFAGLHQLLRPVLPLLDLLPQPQARALGAALGLEDPAGAEPFLTSVATLSLLLEAGASGPVLVVVDDFQWVDPASRDVLLFVARRLGPDPLSLLVASRADEWRLWGDPRLPVLELGGLDRRAADTLLRVRAGTRPAEDVARRLADAAGGNPLALGELAAALTTAQLTGRAPLPVPLPVTAAVEQAFGARLSELPQPVATLLLVVAAEESGQSWTILRAAEDLGVAPSALDTALRERLLVARDGRVEFRHPVIRSAAYSRAAGAERRSAHRALARALAGTDPDRRTWHLAAACEAPDAGVAAELAAAGERARARGAFAEAATAFERAAELSTGWQRSGGLLVGAADAAWRAGLLDQASLLLTRAEDAALDDRLATEVGRLRGTIELAAGDARAACRILTATARACRGTDPGRALDILALAGEAASLALDRDASAELGRLAAEVQVGPHPRERFLQTVLLGFTADFAGDVRTAVAKLRAAVAMAGEIDDVRVKLTGGRAAFYVGDDEAAHRLHLAVVEDARQRGSVELLPLAGPRLALAEVFAGRWASGAATASETATLSEQTGQVDLAPHARAWLALIAALRGDGPETERQLQAALASVEGRPVALIEDAARWVRGVLALGEGRPGDAVFHLGPIAHPVIEVFASLDRLEAAAAAQDARGVSWLAGLRDLAEATEAGWARARLAYGEALLAASPAEAEEHFTRAVEEASGVRRPFERARISLAFGSHLRRHRQRVRARVPLRSALDAFETLGAQVWADRARQELRAAGETVGGRERRAVDELTPQELQIAREVAQGRTNRDVAARFFLSPRTVEFHLGNVFAKLGIRSRTELARLPLADPEGRPAS